MTDIPRVIYGGFVSDCFVGRVIKINKVDYDFMGSYVDLEMVHEIIPNDYHYLGIQRGELTKYTYHGDYDETKEAITPKIGQLIQCCDIAQGYGSSRYIKFLDKLEDEAPVPEDYYELVANRTDCFQI